MFLFLTKGLVQCHELKHELRSQRFFFLVYFFFCLSLQFAMELVSSTSPCFFCLFVFPPGISFKLSTLSPFKSSKQSVLDTAQKGKNTCDDFSDMKPLDWSTDYAEIKVYSIPPPFVEVSANKSFSLHSVLIFIKSNCPFICSRNFL